MSIVAASLSYHVIVLWIVLINLQLQTGGCYVLFDIHTKQHNSEKITPVLALWTMSNPEAASTPSSHDADDGNNTGFPFKLLPDTAKVEILEKIHAPQDKLNILRMLPQLTLNALGYDIAGWDYNSLQFELVKKETIYFSLNIIICLRLFFQ